MLKTAFAFGIGTLLLAATCVHAQPTAGAAGRIEESGFVRIGGIDQFVTIRGDASANPVLLVAHGGPGDVQSPFVEEYAPYEHDFTVVQWDQRGAGRTYAKHGDETPDLSLDRIADDGIEVAEYVKKRLGDPPTVLLGHSWGSVVGAEMAKRRPDLFVAYVGTGQVGSWDRAVRYQRDLVRAMAIASNDRETLDALASTGDFDPRDVEDFLVVSRLLRNRLGEADRTWIAALRERTSEAVTPTEFELIGAGMNLSGRALFPTMIAEDLFTTASRFEIPFVVIQGEEDRFTPTDVAIEYFEQVEAPKKQLHVLPGAGHFALVTHPEQFLAALTAAIER